MKKHVVRWLGEALNEWIANSEAYTEPYQTSKLELFAKIVKNWKALTVFVGVFL